MSQHGKNFTAGPTDRTEIILIIAMLKQAKFGIGRLPPGLAISHNFEPKKKKINKKYNKNACPMSKGVRWWLETGCTMQKSVPNCMQVS